ncbi:MAG TPA: hypothetical protein VHQ45_15470, partial [Gemmatimonadaceae bacterium]|nr:hypothetical protein [Gemmatimonadaceae bacterium]
GLAGLGAGILFTATVALAMGPWVGAFSFPILYLWAAAGALGMVAAAMALPVPPEELRAPPPRLRRILGAMVLVLLLVVAVPTVLFYGSALVWGRAEPAVHLVPSGYEGPVVIIYGDSGGAPERREGKTRVYDIPPGGVLRTRFAADPGWSAPDYFYVDAGGRRTPIVRGAPCADSLPGDPVQACPMPVTWTMSVSAGDSVTPAPPQPEYESYVVGRQANRRELEARWDSVVHWAVFGDSAYRAP